MEHTYPNEAAAPLYSSSGTLENFTERGIDASVGRLGAPDRIEAHKWFNIAALTGEGEAIRLRRELAQEMTADEIATAQRLAREWLKTHPVERPSVAA